MKPNESDIQQYLNALSTLIIAVEMDYRKCDIQAVCKRIEDKTDSSVTYQLCKGIRKHRTPKATVRKLYRDMVNKYKASGYNWTTAGDM